MKPLCMNSQRPCRNGWQFDSWTAEPMAARMCAKNRGLRMWAVSSCRLRSFHAGSTLWKSPGVGSPSYQPMPKPSPFVGSAPSSECRLWSMSEWTGL